MNTTQRNIQEVMRDEMIMRDRIAAIIKEEPKTIPEIAEAIGAPSHETVYWVMAMRRYGMLEETGRPDVDGLFKYEFKEEEDKGHE